MTEADRFYRDYYPKVMSGGLIGRLWKHIHYLLDKPFLDSSQLRIVEVGSGNGQHFVLTNLNYGEYVEVDIRRSEYPELGAKIHDEKKRRFIQEDATLLESISDDSFDGLISTCLLVHLNNPRLALENWRRVVSNHGKISIYVANEPGIVLRFARHFTTKRRISKLGFAHDSLHWSEHRNHFPAMRVAIRQVFDMDVIHEKGFPFRAKFWDLNLFTIYTIEIRK